MMRVAKDLPVSGVAPTRRGIRGLIPVGAALAVITTAACDDEPVGAVTDADPFAGSTADVIQLDYESAITQGGVRAAWVDADSSWSWKDSTAVYLFEMQLAVYDSVGAERARVTSEFGRLETRNQALTARGNVTMNVYGAQQTSIQSEMLQYFPEEGKIRSDSVTRAMIDGSQTTGTCFESDLTFQNFDVCNMVGDILQVGVDSAGGVRGGAPPRARGEGRGR